MKINQYQNNAIFPTQINLISSCHFFDVMTKKSSNDELPYFSINDNVSQYNVFSLTLIINKNMKICIQYLNILYLNEMQF